MISDGLKSLFIIRRSTKEQLTINHHHMPLMTLQLHYREVWLYISVNKKESGIKKSFNVILFPTKKHKAITL